MNYFLCDNKNTTLRTNWYLQFISNLLNAIILLCSVASSEPTLMLLWLFSRSFWCYTVIMLKRWNNRNNRNNSSSWADMCNCTKHVLTIMISILINDIIKTPSILFHFLCHVLLLLTALNRNIISTVLFLLLFSWSKRVYSHKSPISPKYCP